MIPRHARIAYLTPLYFDENSYIGGGERYPLNLAKGVVAASEGTSRVDIISYGRTPRRIELSPGVWLRVLTIHNRPADPLDVLSWDLPEAIDEVDLVHIHAAFTRSGEMGLLVAKQRGKPVCLTDHGGSSSGLGREVGMLELADRVIAYSQFGASFFRTKTRVEIVPGGVDGTMFTPSQVPVVRDRVLYVGRLLPHKGVDRLIEALPDDLPLTVCGRPYHAKYFEDLQALACGKQVSFVTDATDATILDLYRRSWVNVLPSVYRDRYGTTYVAPELMGFTLLEAMACGTPAIAARTGAMPEFIDEGVNGFVFDDVDALRGLLRRLADDPSLVERMGLAARRTVDERFDLTVAGGMMLAIYRDLIDAAREAAA